MNVGLAILTKNESSSFTALERALQAQSVQFSQKIICDDSEDETPLIAEKLGFTVVPGGGSLGSAFVEAMVFFRKNPVDYLIVMDGDGQADPQEISRFLHAAQGESADVVLGSRFLDDQLIDYKYPAGNRWGVRLLSIYLTLEMGQRITDSHGGIRCYSHRYIKSCRIKGRHTYVQESILSARDCGLKVIEISSHWYPRKFGQSRVVRSKLKYALKVAPYLMLRSRRIVPAAVVLATVGLGIRYFFNF